MSKGTVIVADDDNTIRVVLNQALSRAGFNVRITSNASTLWKWVSEGVGDCVVSDVIMPDADAFEILPQIGSARPDLPVVLISAQNTFMTALKAEEGGAFAYLPKPFDLEDLVSTVERAISEPKGITSKSSFDIYQEEMPIVGRSPVMQDIYQKIARLRDADYPVMLIGETGTGKQLIANVLHNSGKRKTGQFVAADLSAIPESRIEEEVFGNGIDPGFLQQAVGGTLYINEIHSLPRSGQIRMLRALRENSSAPNNNFANPPTDMRVITATTQNMRVAVESGMFLKELFYQLNVIQLEIPALRKRVSDIPDLVRHFLKKVEHEGASVHHFDADAVNLLRNQNWPGNVRELQNLVRKICLLYPQETITADIVAAEVQTVNDESPESRISSHLEYSDLRSATEEFVEKFYDQLHGKAMPKDVYRKLLEEFEYPIITATLARTNGNQIQAAEILGLNRNTLRKKIKSLGIRIVKTAK